MQMTIYLKEDDQWLLEQLERQAYAERKGKSQLILSLVDEHFGTSRPASARPGRMEKWGRPKKA